MSGRVPVLRSPQIAPVYAALLAFAAVAVVSLIAPAGEQLPASGSPTTSVQAPSPTPEPTKRSDRGSEEREDDSPRTSDDGAGRTTEEPAGGGQL